MGQSEDIHLRCRMLLSLSVYIMVSIIGMNVKYCDHYNIISIVLHHSYS